jgi:hypothetical protein
MVFQQGDVRASRQCLATATKGRAYHGPNSNLELMGSGRISGVAYSGQLCEARNNLAVLADGAQKSLQNFGTFGAARSQLSQNLLFEDRKREVHAKGSLT